jgi:hypothetical protein
MYNTRRSQLSLPKYNTIHNGKHCIKYEGATLWNMLDENVKRSVSINDCETMIASCDGPVCNCSYYNIISMCFIQHVNVSCK